MPLLDTEQLEIAASARPAPNVPLRNKHMKRANAAKVRRTRRAGLPGAASGSNMVMGARTACISGLWWPMRK
jgi:hypothetical protein